MTTNEELYHYLVAQDSRRDREVAGALATLTAREALLVREAAVMGYVQGQMDAKVGFTEIPRDREIVRQVVLGCISMNGSNPRHYRLIAAAAEGRRPRARREETA